MTRCLPSGPIGLALLLCSVFGCQKQTEAAALSPDDVTAITAMHVAYRQAVLAGGFDSTVRFYAEDAVLMARGPVIRGREALRASLQGLRAASPTITAFSLTLAEIDGRSDLAFVRGTVSMSMAMQGSPEPSQFTGKFLEILRKQADGSWLIARDIRVSD